MSRVLVTGGTGAIGSAVVRRLLADPAYDVRVADRKPAPQWMRESCEIRTGDLREHEHAAAAMRGCDHAIHLARPSEDTDFGLITASAALDSALVRAAIDQRVQRFVFASCANSMSGGASAKDEALLLPAGAFAKLLGERLCRAGQAEHGLPFVICGLSGSGDDADQAAKEIVAALL